MTDLYEVTMALSYAREGMTGPATFSLFARRLPADRGFLVAAGIESCLDYLADLEIDDDDVDALAGLLGRDRREIEPLRGLRFTGEVRAVPEGRIVLAGEPLIEVRAPLPEAQLVETFLLNQVTYQTSIASKAARCVLAARGKPVVDFSLRRTHGVEAGLAAARASALAGFAATSDVAAAAMYGLKATGTMAHSYIEAFGDEEAAFHAFARSTPGPVTLLVDTYNTLEGVRVAARVLEAIGRPGGAIRLDSGELGSLAAASRRILDATGLSDVRIVASGGLDEYAIDDLVRARAPIDVFAVGTKMGTSADAPYLDTAYKLVDYDGRPVMKLSAGKATLPGAKQVFRRPGFADRIAARDEPPASDGEPLLAPVMSDGRRTGPAGTLDAARRRLREDLAALPRAARDIRRPLAPRACPSDHLELLSDTMRRQLLRTPG
ncbi:MAG TPA: nicotinate phosphoribosyltransferase [Streptosporangiaceae bacterium]|nr:nicotinate phosphoribosyltransferase [Streptosporangiaceae bacterium]